MSPFSLFFNHFPGVLIPAMERICKVSARGLTSSLVHFPVVLFLWWGDRTGVWTQGLMVTSQGLFHLSHSASKICVLICALMFCRGVIGCDIETFPSNDLFYFIYMHFKIFIFMY
jgi:hypothetical protein